MSNIIITGGSSGLGAALCAALLSAGNRIYNLDIIGQDNPAIAWIKCDVGAMSSVKVAYAYFKKNKIAIDIFINNAGINFIDWLETTPEEMWDKVMGVNAKGIFNTAKTFLPILLENKATILNIISNASHMPMTNSIAYNASKGAAHIMTLQLARELGPKGLTVFGISPNKLKDTGMSKYIDSTVCGLRGWTSEEAQEYQIKSLAAGEETDPAVLAEFIGFLLSSKERHKYLTGTILPYGK